MTHRVLAMSATLTSLLALGCGEPVTVGGTLVVEPAAVAFTDLLPAEIDGAFVQLGNDGDGTLSVLAVEVTDTGGGLFDAVLADDEEALPRQLEPGETLLLDVSFAGAPPGAYAGLVQVTCDSELLYLGGGRAARDADSTASVATVDLPVTAGVLVVDGDGDGWTAAEGDCDDDDPTAYPGADELCDGVDNDCDGSLPQDEADLDLDGQATCEGDCDDTLDHVYVGAPELCNGVDDDCDGDLPDDEIDDDGDGLTD